MDLSLIVPGVRAEVQGTQSLVAVSKRTAWEEEVLV